MKKILFLLLPFLTAASLFASPTNCPYFPKDCSDLGNDASFWQRPCFFSEHPNTMTLSEVKTTINKEGPNDQGSTVICIYGSPLTGLVFNATATVHLANKTQWSKIPDSLNGKVHHCIPLSSTDCAFSVISN